MKYRFLIIQLLSLISFLAHSEVIYEVYPDGEGIQSLEGAKKAIEDQGPTNQDYIVLLDDGVYYLEEPMVFDVDNGEHSITYKAKEGAHPVITGGRNLTSWSFDNATAGIVKVHVDKYVRNLWVNDSRMKRASGYVGYASGIFEGTIDGEELKGLLFPKADFPTFEDTSGLEIVYYRNWRNYHLKVMALYDSGDVPEIPGGQILVIVDNIDIALLYEPKIGTGHNHPYYFENALELLDEPGEWCYSPSQKVVYYYLRDNETIDDLDAIVPVCQTLISVASKTDRKVKNLTFSGLTFSNNNWELPAEYSIIPLQASTFRVRPAAWQVIPGGVYVTDAKNITFESCKFAHMSSNGIHLKNNVDSINITDCEFIDISGAAICISDKNHNVYTDSVFPVKNVSIHNNLIKDIGREYASCPAIEVYYAEDLTISHNELYDCPYTGISVGWGWSIAPNTQKNVRILNNKIIGDILKCNDGGAIYSLSHFGGNGLLIEGNYIDEITKKPSMMTQGAIYNDEGSSNVYVNNNVVLTDRNWYFYHKTGKIEVDTVYVLETNWHNYDGINIPDGGTDVTFCDDGGHIFCLPHEKADSLMANAGIRKDNPGMSAITDPIKSQERRFIVKASSNGSVRITPDDISLPGDAGYCISVYGIDGRLERRLRSAGRDTLVITDLSAGFHIVVITMRNQSRFYKVVL